MSRLSHPLSMCSPLQPQLHGFPPATERFGFSNNQTGGHMARSMMLPEISILTEVIPLEATQHEYRNAILADNVLGKPTYTSRDKSLRHLLQLYELDPNLALFRVLRKLTAEDRASLPLIAMTCTFCRDAQFRHSFGLIDQLKPGEPLRRERMEEYLEEGFPG